MAKPIKLKNLAAATAASVTAALGKPIPRRPGALAGLIMRDAQLADLGKTADELAKEIARGVGASSGIRVTPGVARLPGGVLVGYRVPSLFK